MRCSAWSSWTPPPLVDSLREATGLPLVTVEDVDATATGQVPSAPQREPERVVEAILDLLDRHR